MKIRFSQVIRINKINANHYLKQFLLIAFLFATIWSRIILHSNNSLLISNIFLSLAGTTGLISVVFQGKRSALLYLAFIVGSWLFEVMIHLGNQYYDLTNIFNTLLFFGSAYIYATTEKNYKLYRALYYIVTLYFFINIVILKLSFRNLLADGNSYNYISCFIIFYFSMYAFALMENKRTIGYFDSILLVFTIIVSYGRGGIAAAIFYGIGFSFIKLYEKRKKAYTYILILIAFAGLVICSDKITEILIANVYFRKFVIYGLDTNGRAEIWAGFISNSMKSILDFLGGANPYDSFIDGNLHNSFLQMWTALGFVFFIVNIVLIFKYTITLIKKKEWYFLLVMWTFFARAFTDKMMFRWYGEILLFYIILKMLVISNNNEAIA